MKAVFNKVSSKMNFPKDEKDVLKFWKDQGIFEKSLKKNEGKKPFVFFEGPPTANGIPHNGHVLTRAIKDVFPRYKTMRGFYAPRKAGWDTHGLPVEVEVEKELGLHGKEAVENYGLEAFTKKCIESVFRYTDIWEDLTERIGFWVDLDEAYVTFHESYVESVWWALSELYKKDLLYLGHKVVWWWPQGGTALSAGEVGLGYKTVDDPSVFVRFPLKGEDKTSLIVWTTTPWTLPSNCAVGVHKDVDYVLLELDELSENSGKERILIAENLIEAIVKDRPYTVIEKKKGQALVGLEYEAPFDFAKAEDGSPLHRIIAADFVTTDSGTGLVHLAPAFGADDSLACQANGIGFINLIKPDGTFDERAGDYSGRFCKDADRDLIRELRKRGLLVREESYRHDYPFCWRKDTDPLIQYARPAWFIRTTAVTDKAIETNQLINWLPAHIKDGRFGDWLKNNVDWALSRERFWGTPLNLWTCPSGHMEAPSSVKDIESRNPEAFSAYHEAKKADPSLSPHLKVHKPWIDKVTFPCPECGQTMERVPEVIDGWFDSGCMPFAQWGWPHKGEERFQASWPADFISEAVDQTRGWFYSLLMVSTLLFSEKLEKKGPHPFKNCIVLGHVTDKHGKKESKSKGNYTPPQKILESDGADAMRWYFYASNPPWNNTRYSPEAVRLGQQEFLVKLHHVYSFFTIYANIDGFHPGESPKVAPEKRSLLDRWILSETQLALKTVTESFDQFLIYEAAESLAHLMDALSNWYVRRSRDRFWAGLEGGQDKWDAYHTLYEVLKGIMLMAAPFTPFIAESLWQNLVRSAESDAPESVHLADWPLVNEALIDLDLSEDMQAVRDIVALGLQARNANRLKVRQPLAKVELILGNPQRTESVKTYASLIQEELNVKELLFTQDAERVSFSIKGNFKLLGPLYGKKVQVINRQLMALDAGEARKELAESGKLSLTLPDGEVLTLDADAVVVSASPEEGWVASSGAVGVVVLETALSEALIEEGRARDILSRIQNWRKAENLDYTARIKLLVGGDPALLKAIENQKALIQKEALVDSIAYDLQAGNTEEIDGMTLYLDISLSS